MTLKDLTKENDAIEVFNDIFYESVSLFMTETILNENFDFTKTEAFKKGKVKKYCRYPKLNINSKKSGTLITSDKNAIKTFKTVKDLIRFKDAITMHLTPNLSRLNNNKRLEIKKAYEIQRNKCIEAVEELYNVYREELRKYNMENAEEGSDKDENCTGTFCNLPDVEEIIVSIKKHVSEFVDYIKIAFKDWNKLPVEIPVFENVNDKLNWLFIQNITFKNMINEQNVVKSIPLLETNLKLIKESIEILINETVKPNKETINKLKDYLRKFAKLIKDVAYTLDELDPKTEAKTIAGLKAKISKYKIIVKSLDKKVAQLTTHE